MTKATITFDVRKANRMDIAHDKQNLKYGQVFFLKSMLSGKMEGPYQISYHTDTSDLADWLKFEMIWVPVDVIENNIKIKTA